MIDVQPVQLPGDRQSSAPFIWLHVTVGLFATEMGGSMSGLPRPHPDMHRLLDHLVGAQQN
jgi:hypothetical protein